MPVNTPAERRRASTALQRERLDSVTLYAMNDDGDEEVVGTFLADGTHVRS